jgi:hypothetical protein
MIAFDGYDGTEGEATAFTLASTGPIADAFVNDKRSTTGIMGPYGSAKTTNCFKKIINATLWQRPGPDGVRRSRGMIVRSTYGQLETNVMADWFEWFPKTADNWNGKEHKHSLRIDMPRIGELWIEVLFRAVDQVDKPEQLFKGVNLTWAWLNEVDTLLPSIRSFLYPRLGRYPGKKYGGCDWFGLFSDMNAPDIDNYTYDWLINQNHGIPDALQEKLREIYGARFGIGFHIQPGGLTPEAENLHNLPPGYYEGLAATMSANDKRRFVDNEFGAVRNGQPVYPEFNDRFHVHGHPLKAIEGVSAVLAIDGGTTPAGVLLQEDPDTGQIRVLDEIVIFANDDQTVLEKMGPKGYAREVARHLDRNWPKLKIAAVVCDPAATYGEHGDDWAWATEFAAELKRKVKPAPGTHGNRLSFRLEAVRTRLTINIGNQPGILVSPVCKYLRQGFNAGYVYTRIRTSSGGGRWRDEPEKNDFSHVHDALQYGVLWIVKKGVASDDADRMARAKRKRPKVNYSGYSAAAA